MINPFKMMGDVNALRKQQAELEKEEIEGRDGNVRVVMSGTQQVKLVEINGEANESLKRAFNDAIKRSQQLAASKIAELTKNMQ
jgi:nucleoid-associated protein EbfC